jgi:hypothetical protein
MSTITMSTESEKPTGPIEDDHAYDNPTGELTPTSDPEKNLNTATTNGTYPVIDLDAEGECEGYILDASLAHADTRDLKTTADGHIILIPQPSNDPNDPLNWSQLRKNIVLLVVSFAAFLPDYGSATGAVTLLPQAAYVILHMWIAVWLTILGSGA